CATWDDSLGGGLF
nr:immunoglobulin light chain junction region [Macaca mulatta]